MNVIPVQEEMCATCPFRPKSKLRYLRADLMACAAKTASRICHSTGQSVIHGNTGLPEKICRGSRNHQLNVFHAAGFLKGPTDEAWSQAVETYCK